MLFKTALLTMAILAWVCTVPASAKPDPEEIVVTVWAASTCPQDRGFDIKRGSYSRNSKTGCYKVQAGHHGIKFHTTGVAFFDFDCNDLAGGGEPPLESCYGSVASEIRGFKIYEHPAE